MQTPKPHAMWHTNYNWRISYNKEDNGLNQCWANIQYDIQVNN